MSGAYQLDGAALMLTIGKEQHVTPLEINIGSSIRAVAFSANWEYLVSGDKETIRVWRVREDDEQLEVVATRAVGVVNCLTVSKDGRRIAAGRWLGDVIVLDAETYKHVITLEDDYVNGLDFSPDSTRLLTASARTASIWDVATRKRVVGPLRHEDDLRAAKFSPWPGDRIATATQKSVRVYSSNGDLLVDISVTVNPWYNTGLLWSKSHLFVVSNSKIEQINASSCSFVSEWPVPDPNSSSCITLPRHGKFIAYSANRSVTFWDTATHAELGHIQHAQDIRSIALSPDDRFIAIGGEGGKISIKLLTGITEPNIQIDDAILDLWKNDQLANTEALLTAAIPASQNTKHHIFGSRALVRARLRRWDAAIDDAEESIEIRPSIIGYLAKSIALVGKGEKHKAYRACDIAFEHVHSPHVRFLLLMKAIIVFIAGEHDDAISRTDDLIATVPFNTTCYVVQAYMYLLIGNLQMESSNYERAIQSFKRAQAQTRHHTSRSLLTISLISGWTFNDLGIAIRQRLCEALFAAGRTNEGGDSFLKIIDAFEDEVYTSRSITKWVSDFSHQCLSASENDRDTATKDEKATALHVPVDSPIFMPLVREWAKATLAGGTWKDALFASVQFPVPKFTLYRVICERLETMDHVTDAIECMQQMENELANETDIHDERAKWIHAFIRRCAEKLGRLGDAAVDARQHDTAITRYSAALSLDPTIGRSIYMKRSKVYVANGLWEEALDDTDQVMTLDPSSPWNFEKVLMEWAKVELTNGSWRNALKNAASFKVPILSIYRPLCEFLEKIDRVTDAFECWQQMTNESVEERDMQAKWVLDFKQRCAERLRRLGHAAVYAQQHKDAITHYSAALSLNPAAPQDIFTQRSKVYVAMGLWEEALDDSTRATMLDPSSQWDYERVLMAWAQATLTDELWKKALATARGFKVPGFTVYQAVCERLEMVNRIVEATECFHEMENRSAQALQGKEAKWAADFKYRCCGRLEAVGDTAMNARRYDEAISHYSAALSLSPTVPQALLVKRSAAYAAREVWQYALNDANEAITLDPSWPFVYEKKYVALRGAGNHQDAIDAFETMLSKMSQSLDPDTRERHRQYTRTKELIRGSIQEAIRESPRVLINTASGRICNKSEQAAAFELLPGFTELISSMTTHVNHARIEQEVKQYYRYATFSHKWEASEPLFDKVINIVVYDLEDSPTHDKLQMFCKIVREAGFNWAWSDTCCINKSDHFVLQEALVAMFKWYEGSSLTVIFLRGVRSPSQHGDLIRSVWNTRAWTFQEYHASKVVRFYPEDWTLYRNLDIPNHKDSPEIIAEMEEATSISAQALMALRPGLDDIREKLCLASRRETTFVEDAAYSLLGIFSVSLPVVYGEGDRSLGRLLAQLLTSSGDTSILAWTGKSGSFNSCLPTHIAVFSQLPTTHIPPVIERAEMDIIAARLRASALDFTLAVKLHDRLNELPVPLFAGRRMKLPCITFKLGPLSVSRSASEYVFRAQTAALGIVAIKTKENLSSLGSLYLIHPWIDFLLDRQPVGRVTESIYEENIDYRFSSISDLPPYPGTSNMTSAVRQSSATRSVSHLGQSFHRPLPAPPQYSDVASLRPPSTISPMDKEMRALRLIARLRQPFGALLLTPNLGNAYSRVAAESLITVQVEGITPTILNKLVVHILDVL